MLALWTERPHQAWMPCLNRPFKRGEAYEEGQFVGCEMRARNLQSQNKRKHVPGELVGSPNEVSVFLANSKIQALLDTGSTVSTISVKFYRRFLSDTCELMSITDLLHVECADGNLLQYSGYIETEVAIPGLCGESLACLLLVVPESSYTKDSPLIWLQGPTWWDPIACQNGFPYNASFLAWLL